MTCGCPQRTMGTRIENYSEQSLCPNEYMRAWKDSYTLTSAGGMLRVGFRRWSCVNSLFVNRRDELRHISGSPAACLFCSRTRDPLLAGFTSRLWNFDSWIFEKPFELSCLFIYFRLPLLPHLTFPSPTPHIRTQHALCSLYKHLSNTREKPSTKTGFD